MNLAGFLTCIDCSGQELFNRNCNSNHFRKKNKKSKSDRKSEPKEIKRTMMLNKAKKINGGPTIVSHA